MSQEPRSGSWWLTLPGVLTGLAAVIMAVTGLAVALHQISAPSGPEKASSEKPVAVTTQNNSKPPPASSDTTTSQTPSSDEAAQESVALPAGMEVKLAGGDIVYKILSASLEPYNAEKRLLKFTIRFTAGSTAALGIGVSTSSFRLLVDDVPREPISFSSEGQNAFLVEAGSAKEDDVLFEVPTTENEVVLQISNDDPRTAGRGHETTKIPFDLTATET